MGRVGGAGRTGVGGGVENGGWVGDGGSGGHFHLRNKRSLMSERQKRIRHGTY